LIPGPGFKWPPLTLAERLERAAQRKARASQEQARLKKLQRNERTRRLIKLGGSAVKAGIDELPANALYACFPRIAKEAQDKRAVAAWEREGAKHFRREADARVVAVAKFTDKIAPEVAASLGALGFRWNRYLGEWEGKVDHRQPKELVEGESENITAVKARSGNTAAKQRKTLDDTVGSVVL
jgi:hypothetical protein